MNRSDQLADTLKALLGRAGWSAGALAKNADVPKSTIDNWLCGRVTRPRTWHPLIQVAAALELDQMETSRLLALAGHPTVMELLALHLPRGERALLEPWANDEASSSGAHEDAGDSGGLHLPGEFVPAVSALPSASRVHLRRNPFFVGRHHLLMRMAQTLGGHERMHDQRIDTVVLAGIGGVGKTQLAAEWAHRYGQFFAGGVYWISCADPSAIPATVAMAGRHSLRSTIPSIGLFSLQEQVRLVWDGWHDDTPRLLIFDGCEDPAVLQQWRPANGGASVVVTSRRANWDAQLGVRVLPVGTLDRTESTRLLCHYRPECTHEHGALDAIADLLGDLPLTLHLAGAYVRRYRHVLTLGAYAQQLCDLERDGNGVLDHPSLLGGVYSPTDHVQHVAHTFARSYEQLDEADALDGLALLVLAHAAFAAPKAGMPRHQLHAHVRSHTAQPFSVYAFEDALARLLDLGLLVADDERVWMHRLVAHFVKASTLVMNARA
jgi:transcriptional regulator with XRE-family HTH domain